jgi:hypothetical protein
VVGPHRHKEKHRQRGKITTHTRYNAHGGGHTRWLLGTQATAVELSTGQDEKGDVTSEGGHGHQTHLNLEVKS